VKFPNSFRKRASRSYQWGENAICGICFSGVHEAGQNLNGGSKILLAEVEEDELTSFGIGSTKATFGELELLLTVSDHFATNG
jgi:hypothetical protein